MSSTRGELEDPMAYCDNDVEMTEDGHAVDPEDEERLCNIKKGLYCNELGQCESKESVAQRKAIANVAIGSTVDTEKSMKDQSTKEDEGDEESSGGRRRRRRRKSRKSRKSRKGRKSRKSRRKGKKSRRKGKKARRRTRRRR